MNTQIQTEIEILIKPEDRLNILPKYCGNHLMKFEAGVYDIACLWDKKYTGGFWEFVELGDCFFMYPKEDRMYSASTSFHTEEVNNVTFGMAATQMIVNQMSWHLDNVKDNLGSKKFATMYHTLRDRTFNDLMEDKWKEMGLDIGKVISITD